MGAAVSELQQVIEQECIKTDQLANLMAASSDMYQSWAKMEAVFSAGKCRELFKKGAVAGLSRRASQAAASAAASDHGSPRANGSPRGSGAQEALAEALAPRARGSSGGSEGGAAAGLARAQLEMRGEVAALRQQLAALQQQVQEAAAQPRQAPAAPLPRQEAGAAQQPGDDSEALCRRMHQLEAGHRALQLCVREVRVEQSGAAERVDAVARRLQVGLPLPAAALAEAEAR